MNKNQSESKSKIETVEQMLKELTFESWYDNIMPDVKSVEVTEEMVRGGFSENYRIISKDYDTLDTIKDRLPHALVSYALPDPFLARTMGVSGVDNFFARSELMELDTAIETAFLQLRQRVPVLKCLGKGALGSYTMHEQYDGKRLTEAASFSGLSIEEKAKVLATNPELTDLGVKTISYIQEARCKYLSGDIWDDLPVKLFRDVVPHVGKGFLSAEVLKHCRAYVDGSHKIQGTDEDRMEQFPTEAAENEHFAMLREMALRVGREVILEVKQHMKTQYDKMQRAE